LAGGVVNFEWDPQKARRNKAKHGVSFELVRSFDLDNAKIVEDDDVDYGESRLVAIGLIRDRIYVLVFVERDDVIRGYFASASGQERGRRVCRVSRKGLVARRVGLPRRRCWSVQRRRETRSPTMKTRESARPLRPTLTRAQSMNC
jgi:uncharacterized protein